MYIDEIIGILIVVSSIIFAILGYHLNIEILTSLSTFSAGAFTTYVVQHRLQIKAEKASTHEGYCLRPNIPRTK